jgi:hypothetical protein
VALISTSSCSISKDKTIAEHAVDQFHSRLNKEQYREIYLDADEKFREGGSETDLLATLRTVRERLSNTQGSNQVGYKVSLSQGGKEIILNYKTDFGNGAANEEFVWWVRNGQARLVRYHIISPLLAPN